LGSNETKGFSNLIEGFVREMSRGLRLFEVHIVDPSRPEISINAGIERLRIQRGYWNREARIDWIRDWKRIRIIIKRLVASTVQAVCCYAIVAPF
jgi:hypothetical protein